MKTFEERLAAAQSKPRPHKDVPVCLDDEIVEQRDALRDDIERAQKAAESDQRLAGPNPVAEQLADRLSEIERTAAASLLTLRFRRLPGNEWAALALHFPPRPNVPVDRQWGYNFDGLCGAAAAHVSPDDSPSAGTSYGFRVETDEDGAETEVPMPPAQWAALFSVLAGSDVADIRDAIWGLNEAEPENRLDGLVKGFGAARGSVTK